jgi:hypothetical protein
MLHDITPILLGLVLFGVLAAILETLGLNLPYVARTLSAVIIAVGAYIHWGYHNWWTVLIVVALGFADLLRIHTTIPPHPVQPNPQPTSHRYLRKAFVPAHCQVYVPTSPIRMNARCGFGCFHQQEALQRIALLADVSKSLLASSGLLTRNHPHVRADLLAALKPSRGSDDQHISECRNRTYAGMRQSPGGWR